MSIEQQFNEVADRRLHYQQLKLVDEVFRDYKKETGKVDFVDMIENFIEQGECPLLDVLIVDEVQDLVPLQWRMVHEVMKPNAKRAYAEMMISALFLDGCERKRFLGCMR